MKDRNFDEYNFLLLFDATQAKSRQIAVKKNKDYGSSFAKHGVADALARVSNNFDRHLRVDDDESIHLVNREKLESDLLDNINYLTYVYMMLKYNDLLEVNKHD